MINKWTAIKQMVNTVGTPLVAAGEASVVASGVGAATAGVVTSRT